MKKLILSLLVATSTTLSSFAQLPNGSIAPDWTLTDINGNTHNLYSLTNAGYTVILNMSATWNPLCWNYHQSNTLNDVWTNHGPIGQPGVSATTTDDVWVFHIEMDSSTDSTDLNGTSSNTQGNWISGTNYPIIDNSSLNFPYQLSYIPTIYTICPSRTVIESGQTDANTHYSIASSCNTVSGTNNAALISYHGDTSSCYGIDAIVTLQNLGTANLTSATIEVFDGNTSVTSTNWTGNLATYETEQISIGTIFPSSTTNYNFSITSYDDDTTDNSIFQQLSPAPEAIDNQIIISIETDAYGSETTWELKTSNGNIISTGGPYNDLSSIGTTQHTPVNLIVNENDCLEFTIYDMLGDGMDSGYGEGSYTIYDGVGNILATGGNFDSEESSNFWVFYMNVDDRPKLEFKLVPNPTNGLTTLEFSKPLTTNSTVEILNMLGEVIFSKEINPNNSIQQLDIDASFLSSGVYIISLKEEKNTYSTRLILEKQPSDVLIS